VLWCGRPPDPQVGPEVRHIDMSTRWEHPPQPWEALAGLSRQPDDVAGYMHTSGTSGTPKLCAQTHRYFLSLARVVADGMSLSPADRVYVPLPLYHVNPLGYGVLGGLMGCADIVLGGCFSASRFWPDVIGCAATVLMLHSPPVEILKRSTSQADAAGHVVRSAFLADRSFQQKFGIPLVWSAYGSTEGGGLSHLWGWRLGEPAGDVLEASRVGGRCRDDIRWSLSSEGEILLRGEQPGLLVRGYRKKGDVPLPVDAEGWFHTGDLGRIDDEGRLVFVERLAESIRVKGEYVPIGYVEDRLAAVAGISDLAVWRRDSELVDHELVLYIVADTIPVQGVTAASQSLPPFMRPSVIRRVPRVPRDEGVGKVRRRELDSVPVLEEARIR
jgi:acyl-CoA synthetase (AMP-forming)/AMP-acid ligase II